LKLINTDAKYTIKNIIDGTYEVTGERKYERFGTDLNLHVGLFPNNRECNLAPFYASPWHNNGNAMVQHISLFRNVCTGGA